MATQTYHGSGRLGFWPWETGLRFSRGREPSLLIGRGTYLRRYLPIWPAGTHAMVVGPTRSGKSSAFYLPNLLEAAAAAKRAKNRAMLPSFVCSDPKAELLAVAGPELADAGYAIHVYAPGVPRLSEGFDPLPWCLDEAGRVDYASVKDMTGTVMPSTGKESDPYWSNAARLILTASLVVAAKKPGATFGHALALLYAAPGQVLELGARLDPWAASQLAFLMENLGENPKVLGTIRSEIPAHLGTFTTPDLLHIYSSPSFRWPQIWERPTAVFVVARQAQSAMQALAWGSLLAEIRRGPPKLPRPLILFLDEFANSGKVPNMAEAVTTAAGKGVSIFCGLQSISQVEAVYGQDAGAILGNLVNRIVFPGSDPATAQQLSNGLGKKSVHVQTRSDTHTGVASWQASYVPREVMTADEISRMGGQWVGRDNSPPPILFHRLGKYGARIGTCPYYLDSRFKHLGNVDQEARLDPWRHPLDHGKTLQGLADEFIAMSRPSGLLSSDSPPEEGGASPALPLSQEQDREATVMEEADDPTVGGTPQIRDIGLEDIFGGR